MLWCTETCNTSSLPYQDSPSQQSALGSGENTDSVSSISLALHPKDRVFLRVRADIQLLIYSIDLPSCCNSANRNYLLDLLRVNICLVCSFPEKEKSHDPVTMNTVKGGQGLGFKFVCIPCLLILLFFFFKSKHTIALCFYMTCHLRSYSFLKMQGKVSAHTPRLQKWLFYSKVINRKKSKHVDSTAQFTPTPSLPGTWKKRAHKQPQQPVFTDLSQVSYTKQKTQELIPSKKPSQSQGWTSHRSAVMLCNLPPTPWAPRPGPISPRMLPCWLTDCTFAQRKAQFSWALDWSFSSRDTIPRCRLAPRPFLLVMPHVCIIADICSGGRAIGPLLQWHAGSMLQPPQRSKPAQTVQRRENSDSTTAKRFPRGKKIILYFYRYCIDMLYWHVMRNSLQKRTGMGQKLC